MYNTAGVEYEDAEGKTVELSSETVQAPLGELPPEEPPVPTPTASSGPDFCIRTMTGLDDEGREQYKVDFCRKHERVDGRAAALVSAAGTGEEQLAAWRQSVSLWTDAMNAEYDALLAAAGGEEKQKIAAERAQFIADLDACRTELNAAHPDDPVLVEMRIAEALGGRTAELCHELHTTPKAR